MSLVHFSERASQVLSSHIWMLGPYFPEESTSKWDSGESNRRVHTYRCLWCQFLQRRIRWTLRWVIVAGNTPWALVPQTPTLLCWLDCSNVEEDGTLQSSSHHSPQRSLPCGKNCLTFDPTGKENAKFINTNITYHYIQYYTKFHKLHFSSTKSSWASIPGIANRTPAYFWSSRKNV
jgi:hypothetical protein